MRTTLGMITTLAASSVKQFALATMAGVIAIGLSSSAWSGDVGESEKVVRQFLSAWDARNLDAMMTAYTNDAAVIMPQQKPFKGKDQIRTLMKGFVDDFSKPGAVWNTYAVTADGDVVYILWNAETPTTKFPFGSNTFVVAGGKIVYQ